ncbi:hypothetical protein PENTCL1PPCAC_28718 [Pristionchus entomophagus]|uniref:Dehydrogenase n=1 Tax=Pristionchus entomophagus TaxID=358040 RepID=A0AAV5UHU3_9BILA|nr:hypothetical protein PENTCL1PPCAC_28718 [Pristionchus entomophagus]
MTSILVTGASCGIGLGLARHLLTVPSLANVIATVSTLESAETILSYAKVADLFKGLGMVNGSRPKLHIVQLDVTNEESITNAAKKVSDIVGENGLDILINNAGVTHELPFNEPIPMEKLLGMWQVNATAPLRIANEFRPLLKKAASLKGSAQIANVLHNCVPPEYAKNHPNDASYTTYTKSKVAMNNLTTKIAEEWNEDKIRVTSLDPGWVKTDPRPEAADPADLTVDESTIPLMELILSLTEDYNGKFVKTELQ